VPLLSKKERKKKDNESLSWNAGNSDHYQTLVLFIENEQSPSMLEQLP